MAVRKKGLPLEGWTEILRDDARAAKGGSRTRLDIGQSFRNVDLLRAMLMASDNRAPTALGRAAGLDRDALVAAMNAVARDLGLKKTRFTDPSGLRGNVSTAREMGLALRALSAEVEQDGPLGLAPAGRLEWPHVRLHPLTFDRLELVGLASNERGTDAKASALAGELWIGLVRTDGAGFSWKIDLTVTVREAGTWTFKGLADKYEAAAKPPDKK